MGISDAFFAIAIALIAISVFANVYSLNRSMKDTTNYIKDNNTNVRELLKLVMSVNAINREAIANFNNRLLSIEQKFNANDIGENKSCESESIVYREEPIASKSDIKI